MGGTTVYRPRFWDDRPFLIQSEVYKTFRLNQKSPLGLVGTKVLSAAGDRLFKEANYVISIIVGSQRIIKRVQERTGFL